MLSSLKAYAGYETQSVAHQGVYASTHHQASINTGVNTGVAPLNLQQIARRMREPGADFPLIPDYMIEVLEEQFPRINAIEGKKSAANEEQEATLEESFIELISSVSDPEVQAKFMARVKKEKDITSLTQFMFTYQEEADFKMVDLKTNNQRTEFALNNHRSSPFHQIYKEKRLGKSVEKFLDELVKYFKSKNVRVACVSATSALNANQLEPEINLANNGEISEIKSADINPLQDEWGIFEDTRGNTFIGYFNESGLLEGKGMVLNDAKGSKLTGYFENGLLQGQGIYIDGSYRFYGEYDKGRGNGAGLVASTLGETVSIGLVSDGQIQIPTPIDQDTDEPDTKESGEAGEGPKERQRCELGDFVDGTFDITAEFENDKHPPHDIAASSNLNFIPEEFSQYRRLHRVGGKNVSQFHILSLPDGSYVGTMQAKTAIVPQWTYKNGHFAKVPLRMPALVSELERATVALEGKKGKKGKK